MYVSSNDPNYFFKVSADAIKEILGFYLKVPVDNRWNSFLIGITQLISLYEEKQHEIRQIYKRCNIENHYIMGDQLQFLKKYQRVSLLNQFKINLR